MSYCTLAQWWDFIEVSTNYSHDRCAFAFPSTCLKTKDAKVDKMHAKNKFRKGERSCFISKWSVILVYKCSRN